MRYDDLGGRKSGILDVADHLGGCFDSKLPGVHIHGGQLWKTELGEQRIVEGKDGKVILKLCTETDDISHR